MGAADAPALSQGGDGNPRARGRLPRVPIPSFKPGRTPAIVTAAAIVALAVAFVAAVTYFGARTFTSRAADQRAGEEAASFAMHSSSLATGDAFNGYLQILRYSEDPVLRDPNATLEARQDAMQQLLWLNTDKMSSLAVVARSGLVLAATDDEIVNVRQSTAFSESRANLGPANSDIVLPAEGERGFVEFTSPLRDAEGAVWGFLYARARPQDLWLDTLNATIDGGHNVIISSEGLLAAGVPDMLIGQPWSGSPMSNGSVRATIAGEDRICGVGTIGKDTQIDRGWFIASCLPASLIQVEAERALGSQWQITLAAAVLAIVVAGGLLRVMLALPAAPVGDHHPKPLANADSPTAEIEAANREEEPARLDLPKEESPLPDEPAAEPEPEPVADVTVAAEPAPPPPVVVLADVDALSLIGAYERRNALLSEELRESVQARIMIAVTRAEEAYNLVGVDPERARPLHDAAIADLNALRDRDLRAIGQELHPSLVRLGLPGALRSLRKEFEGRIDITLALDSNVDGASSRGGRITIDARLRLVLYRLVRDAVRAALGAGATSASVSIERDSLEIAASVRAALPTPASRVPDTLLAAEVALQAFGGTLTIDPEGDELCVAARVIAPHVEQPEPVIEPSEVEDADDPPEYGLEVATPAAHVSSADSGLNPTVLPKLTTTFRLTDDEPVVVEAGDDGVEPTVAPPPATTFRLPDGEPSVVEAADADGTNPDLPFLATTFRIPDDEPEVIDAAGGPDEPARERALPEAKDALPSDDDAA